MKSTVLAGGRRHGVPGRPLHVIDHGGGGTLVVVDGARRLAALMRLAEPGRLDDTSLPAAARRSMARIAAGGDPDRVETIRCLTGDDGGHGIAGLFRRCRCRGVGPGR